MVAFKTKTDRSNRMTVREFCLDHSTWLLVAIIVTVWSPLFLSRPFVNWDDNENYLNHPNIAGGLFNNLQHIFSPLLGVIEPCANVVKLLVIAVTGTNVNDGSARPFLLCNLLIHCCNTMLIQKLAVAKREFNWNRNLILIPALFAVHPLRVEAVAWASCLPYQVATFFSLLGCLCHETGRHRWKAFFFLCAVSSKASSITVPLSLFCTDMWSITNGNHVYRSIRCNLTSLFMTVCGVILAMWANQESPIVRNMGWDAKIVRACWAWWWYWLKSIIPTNLNVIYILPGGTVEHLNVMGWFGWMPLSQPVLATCIVLTTCVGILLRAESIAPGRFDNKNADTRSFQRRWAMFLINYTIVLMPCLGLVQHGYLTMTADRCK